MAITNPGDKYAPQGIAPSKTVRCVLHRVHVPDPAILEGHHVIPKGMQKELGVILPKFGEVVWVCPTGHANIHQVLARLLRGEHPVGRRGLTGRLAMRAFYWYVDNNYGQGGKNAEDNIRSDRDPRIED